MSTEPRIINVPQRSNDIDEAKFKELKERGVKFRHSISECLTPEEIERYRLNERIKKRKSREKILLTAQLNAT